MQINERAACFRMSEGRLRRSNTKPEHEKNKQKDQEEVDYM